MIEIANINDKYITYIDGVFDKNNIQIDLSKNLLYSKPMKGFWGSPVNADYGWKQFCIGNYINKDYDFDNPVYWHLEDGSKILRIEIEDVLYKDSVLLKYIKTDQHHLKYIDFNDIAKDSIVAVELMDSSIGHRFRNTIEMLFNTWDCESIVVLDKSKIVFEEV